MNNAIKSIISGALSFISICGFSQIQEVKVKDSTLLKLLHIAMDSVENFNLKERSAYTVNDSEYNQFVIAALISNMNVNLIEIETRTSKGERAFKPSEEIEYNLEIRLERNIVFFKYNVPSAVSTFDSRKIFWLSGLEKLSEIPEKVMQANIKQVKKFLPWHGVYATPAWNFTVRKNEIRFVARSWR